MKHRNGSMLVELVLSMSAGSAVMLLAISLVHQTMSLAEKSRHWTDNHRTIDQLAQNFRRDIRLASEIEVTSEEDLLIKNPDGSSVSYTLLNHSVVRHRKHASSGNENERFILGDGSSASFQRISNPERISLTVSSETGLDDFPSRVDLHVESIVGRWRSLEQDKGASE
ncbi:MAG TPA: hypothetical protein VM260_19550 [Pirellula sp.]|nr:hypothetical protein [Pirellula sp.]